jgi:antitoxin ParD1/3/4
MHISLTRELESFVKEKVASGSYNNASEVIREALRFMQGNDELVQQMKLEFLRQRMADSVAQIEDGKGIESNVTDIINKHKKNKKLDS